MFVLYQPLTKIFGKRSSTISFVGGQEDLFFRLNVIPINLPQFLRERKEDVLYPYLNSF